MGATPASGLRQYIFNRFEYGHYFSAFRPAIGGVCPALHDIRFHDAVLWISTFLSISFGGYAFLLLVMMQLAPRAAAARPADADSSVR
jgi:hypothetical protein